MTKWLWSVNTVKLTTYGPWKSGHYIWRWLFHGGQNEWGKQYVEARKGGLNREMALILGGHYRQVSLYCAVFSFVSPSRHFQTRRTSTRVWLHTRCRSGCGWVWSTLLDVPSTTTSMTPRPTPGTCMCTCMFVIHLCMLMCISYSGQLSCGANFCDFCR